MASALMGLGFGWMFVCLLAIGPASGAQILLLLGLALIGVLVFVLGGVLSGKPLPHWISLDAGLF